ncbi:MAG: stage II sporulation protein D [Clostridiales bacterium]|jgi:stage II sporulation protein D|nr:stage II sporulation protein D [Clostridiales bacterium]
MKKSVICLFGIFIILIIVPFLVTLIFTDRKGENHINISPKDGTFAEESEIPKGSAFENYITGVVAAEMPALYDEEALKAQAVAARTYALNYITRTGDNDYMNIGQAYISVDEMKSRWGEGFDAYYTKVSKAVSDTSGEVMVYDGEPIVAVFHALSAGKTENSEDVWTQELPYLKSVDSSFDEQAKGFITRMEFKDDDFITRLKAYYPDISFEPGDIIDQIKVEEYTDAGYVKTVAVGDKVIEGTELRRILELKSANFTVYGEQDKIVFETKGYGHGAGMSQTGANYLAENGYGYREILEHYYNGVSIEKRE